MSGVFGRSFASGVVYFVAFALGFGVVLVGLTVALAMARQSMVHGPPTGAALREPHRRRDCWSSRAPTSPGTAGSRSAGRRRRRDRHSCHRLVGPGGGCHQPQLGSCWPSPSPPRRRRRRRLSGVRPDLRPMTSTTPTRTSGDWPCSRSCWLIPASKRCVNCDRRSASWRSTAATSRRQPTRSRRESQTRRARRCTPSCNRLICDGTSRRLRSNPRRHRQLAKFIDHVDVAVADPRLRTRGLLDDACCSAGPIASSARHVGDGAAGVDRSPRLHGGRRPSTTSPPPCAACIRRNPVNLPPAKGVQIELPPRVRGTTPLSKPEHTEALIEVSSCASRHGARARGWTSASPSCVRSGTGRAAGRAGCTRSRCGRASSR